MHARRGPNVSRANHARECTPCSEHKYLLRTCSLPGSNVPRHALLQIVDVQNATICMHTHAKITPTPSRRYRLPRGEALGTRVDVPALFSAPGAHELSPVPVGSLKRPRRRKHRPVSTTPMSFPDGTRICCPHPYALCLSLIPLQPAQSAEDTRAGHNARSQQQHHRHRIHTYPRAARRSCSGVRW